MRLDEYASLLPPLEQLLDRYGLEVEVRYAQQMQGRTHADPRSGHM